MSKCLRSNALLLDPILNLLLRHVNQNLDKLILEVDFSLPVFPFLTDLQQGV